MQGKTRREFLQRSLAGGLTVCLPAIARGRRSWAGEPSSQVRIAIVGLGGIDIVGGVGGRGRQLIEGLRQVPGARVVALCDVDQTILDREVRQCREHGEQVAACRDFRKLLDDKSIDAVAIATPNHWHALATIWACQAGKDVYVEKPFSYNIWEGRQMLAAARKYGRMVQVGTQRRSSQLLRQAFEQLRGGQLGPIRCVHALVYRPRDGIGKVAAPISVPTSVDYDLWCGPAPRAPLARRQLHYDWHWIWATGNGEIGNNGAHLIDIGRWALGQDKPAPRVVSMGGRFGFQDDGETPNTQIALFDYQPAPLLCEVRNLRRGKDASAIGSFRGNSRGIVVDCEGGSFVGDSTGGAFLDRQGQKIKDLPIDRQAPSIEVAHLSNFLDAVRNRNAAVLNAEAMQGHVSAACCHMANVSQRLGKQTAPDAILAANTARGDLAEAFQRCREYLRTNGVDLTTTPAVVGPWLTFDPEQEQFVGDFSAQANELCQREYREPFVVPRFV